MDKCWYQRWFGEDYKSLYPHRNQAQAQTQTKALIRLTEMPSTASILDVGCGNGRHLSSFQALGFRNAIGVDLSSILLKDARASQHSVAQADMRNLPFADQSFHLLCCFFTSFGYFPELEDDIAVLQEFIRVVKPEGALFLDLHNASFVKRHLITRDEKKVDGLRVEQERYLEKDCIIKRINIHFPDGTVAQHMEKIRLFPLATLHPIFERLHLVVEKILGDEKGTTYAEETSPRMSLLLRRKR